MKKLLNLKIAELKNLIQVRAGFIAGAFLTRPTWIDRAAQKRRVGIKSTAGIADIAYWVEPV
jgi:hypothetical protein